MNEVSKKRGGIQETLGVIIVVLGAVPALSGSTPDILTMMAFFIGGAAIVRNGMKKRLLSEIINCDQLPVQTLKAKKWIASKQRKIDIFLVKWATPLLVIAGGFVYLKNHNIRIPLLLVLVIVIAVYDYFIMIKLNETVKGLINEAGEGKSQ